MSDWRRGNLAGGRLAAGLTWQAGMVQRRYLALHGALALEMPKGPPQESCGSWMAVTFASFIHGLQAGP